MKFYHLLGIFLITGGLFGCNTNPPKEIFNNLSLSKQCRQLLPTAKIITPSEQDKAELLKTLPLADMAAQRGQFSVAITNYLIAAKLSQSEKLVAKALYFSEKTQDSLSSLEAARLWSDIKPYSLVAKRMLVVGYMRSHQSDKIQQTFEAIRCVSQTQPEGSLLTTLELIKQDFPSDFIKSELSVFSNNHPKDIEILLAWAKAEEIDGNMNEAEQLVNKALTFSPKNETALEIKGLLLTQKGAMITAEKFFEQASKQNPSADNLRLHWSQLLYQKRDFKNSIIQAKKLFANKKLSDRAKFITASALYAQKKYSQSESLFLELLQNNYQTNTLNYFLGEIKLILQDPDLALQFFDTVQTGSYLIKARIASAEILQGQGKLNPARQRLTNLEKTSFQDIIQLAVTDIKLLNEANKLDQESTNINQDFNRQPDNIFFFVRALLIAENSADRLKITYKALKKTDSKAIKKNIVIASSEISNQNQDPKTSLKILEEYLKTNQQDVNIRYSQSMIKAQLGDLDGMEVDLRKILEIAPNHTDALNALGYSLADKNIDLELAFEMIMKAYKKRPKSSAISDSLGWILFRQSKLSKAIIYLKNAWFISPSAEIGAHLGEVYWTQNNKDNAMQIWKMAKKMSPDNSVLSETLSRFKVKIP